MPNENIFKVFIFCVKELRLTVCDVMWNAEIIHITCTDMGKNVRKKKEKR
jgi:hypothetical protein